MKTLNLTFTEAEFAKLKKAKQEHYNKSWHDFVLRLSNGVSIKRVCSGSHPRHKQKPVILK